MKALSLIQPWATLVVAGAKKIETRSEGSSVSHTRHRGPLAIHASKGFPGWARELCFREPFLTALLELGVRHPTDLPLGAVLGTVELIGVRRFFVGADLPAEPERSFGDYTFGRYGLVLELPCRFAKPVPCRGSLGLWEWMVPAGTQIGKERVA